MRISAKLTALPAVAMLASCVSSGDKQPEQPNVIIQQNLNSTLSIVKDGWKYIEPSEAEQIEFWTKTELGNDLHPQLYNLSKDGGEKNNLAEGRRKKMNILSELLEKEKGK